VIGGLVIDYLSSFPRAEIRRGRKAKAGKVLGLRQQRKTRVEKRAFFFKEVTTFAILRNAVAYPITNYPISLKNVAKNTPFRR